MQELINYQEQGFAATLGEANREIAHCRAATPTACRDLYRSFIRYTQRGYLWGWVLIN